MDSAADSETDLSDSQPTTSTHNVELGHLGGGHGIPATVLAAYQAAADRIATENPLCGLRWEVLAGIGKIESSHARGGRLTADGDAAPLIIGPVLNGVGPVAAIRDTDGGRWDRDSVWDRAAGPMQFIPGTWRAYGADGSGDGQANPHNIFDATLSAGYYLCARGADLTTDAGLRSALLRYNRSTSYVANVTGWINAYTDGSIRTTDDHGPGRASSSEPVAAANAEPGPEPERPPSLSPVGPAREPDPGTARDPDPVRNPDPTGDDPKEPDDEASGSDDDAGGNADTDPGDDESGGEQPEDDPDNPGDDSDNEPEDEDQDDPHDPEDSADADEPCDGNDSGEDADGPDESSGDPEVPDEPDEDDPNHDSDADDTGDGSDGDGDTGCDDPDGGEPSMDDADTDDDADDESAEGTVDEPKPDSEP